MVKIMTLMDNLNSEHKSLTAEHGLSFYVETGSTKLLFDFGGGEATWQNAGKLDIPLDLVTHLVFSHSHYDHAAGFIPLAERGYKKTVVYGPGFFQPKYALGENKYTYLGCGFSEEYMKQHSSRQILCDGMYQIDSHSYVIGRFDRTHEYEKIQNRFVKEGTDGMIQDQFEDEVCLAIDTSDGVVVIVGCSHPGILNILQTVKTRMNRPICAVIGGTHLVEADEVRVEQTVKEMKTLGIGLLGMNHCSGMAAEEIIHKDERICSCHLGVGDCLRF